TLFGEGWRDFIVTDIGKNIKTRRGQFDLCVFFFLQACRLVNTRGMVGEIATNSLAQGDSRIICLSQLYANGYRVIRASNTVRWPGDASTHICLVWITSSYWRGDCWLDKMKVPSISDSLSYEGQSLDCHLLIENKRKAFRGAMPYGEGFF